MVKNVTIPTNEENQNGDDAPHGNVDQVFQLLSTFQKNIISVTICTLTVAIISLTATIVFLVLHQVPVTINIISAENNFQNNQSTETPLTGLGPKNSTISDSFRLVSRQEWLAQPPMTPLGRLTLPVPYVIIHHTATQNCSSQATCTFYVSVIQSFHIKNRNWWDIGYNFLVGGDGSAYEGRGWTAVGAHTYRFNAQSLGIAFIGGFNNTKPPQKQIEACKQLMAKGVELGYIRHDYKVLAAKQLQDTESPGALLYEELKTWDHWSPTL